MFVHLLNVYLLQLGAGEFRSNRFQKTIDVRFNGWLKIGWVQRLRGETGLQFVVGDEIEIATVFRFARNQKG